MQEAPSVNPPAARECGACTLCCKVFDVPETQSPAGSWCRHCAPGEGCRVWLERPRQCRDFFCNWITQTWLGPEWKPDRAGIVFTMQADSGFLQFQVDPGKPDAWKKEPYYSQIKRWGIEALRRGRCALVFVNKAATLVLPDHDAALGELGPRERINILTSGDGRFKVEVRRV